MSFYWKAENVSIANDTVDAVGHTPCSQRTCSPEDWKKNVNRLIAPQCESTVMDVKYQVQCWKGKRYVWERV